MEKRAKNELNWMQNEKIGRRGSKKREAQPTRNKYDNGKTVEKRRKWSPDVWFKKAEDGHKFSKNVTTYKNYCLHTRRKSMQTKHTNFIMENDYCKTGLNMLATEIQSRKSNWTIYTKSTPEFLSGSSGCAPLKTIKWPNRLFQQRKIQTPPKITISRICV